MLPVLLRSLAVVGALGVQGPPDAGMLEQWGPVGIVMVVSMTVANALIKGFDRLVEYVTHKPNGNGRSLIRACERMEAALSATTTALALINQQQRQQERTLREIATAIARLERAA